MKTLKIKTDLAHIFDYYAHFDRNIDLYRFGEVDRLLRDISTGSEPGYTPIQAEQVALLVDSLT